MKTRAAMLREAPGKYEVVELDLEGPRQGEIMVKLAASGLCHTDDHAATGDMPKYHFPLVGGHEGAGTVVEIGENTPGWEVGDKVVFAFLPACGKCRWCAHGQQNLCDRGANLDIGSRLSDPESFRMSFEGEPVAQMFGISTFSEYTTVDVDSAIKLAPDANLEVMCLLGCGVGTGWGSAVNAANLYPGDTVIVMGIGGVGVNAVQGAKHAGATNIIAVDPNERKHAWAKEFGATHAFTSIEEAADFGRSVTNWQGADAAIVTVGVTTPEHVAQAFSSVRKAGTVVVTGVGDASRKDLPISIVELTTYTKRLVGALFGNGNATADIPWMVDLYNAGKLKLDELVTSRYTLDQIGQGYEDMHAGKNLRGIIVYE